MANLALRFALELGALAALAYAAMQAPLPLAARVALAVAGPLLAALVWGAFVSPKARYRVGEAARALVEAAFMGSAALALAAAGRPLLGLAFGATALVSGALHRLRAPEEHP